MRSRINGNPRISLGHWETVYEEVLKYQRIWLSSHVLYGSSRLGTKDYLPGQYYVLRDYSGPDPIIDSSSLTARSPWYSMKYNDDISSIFLDPYGHAYSQPFAMAERTGEKQYEETNHLGNVQATVSDNKVDVANGQHDITGWHPALRSAYDYYPFGMLMPGRYVSDTSQHCLTISEPKWEWEWVVVRCWEVYDWEWPGYIPIYGGLAEVDEDNVLMAMPDAGDGVSFTLPVTGGEPQELNITVDRVDMAGEGASAQVLEQTQDGRWHTLAQQAISRDGGNIALDFTPSSSATQVQLSLLGPLQVHVTKVCLLLQEWVQENELVTICNGDGDKYRFGFNGQEKVNEWAGIGNHNTAKFWEYDTRTGRRLNLDPKPNISHSIYATFNNSPISISDPLGDTDRVANYFFSSGKKPGEFNQNYYRNKGDQSAYQREWDREKANLKVNGFGRLVSYIENCKETIHVVQATDVVGSVWMRTSDGFMLVYNPRGGLATTSGHFLSPRTVLVHELAHAVDNLKHPFLHWLRANFREIQYYNLEEHRVITTYEQKAALQFGDIKEGEITRTDHKGTIYRTEDFNTNKKASWGGIPVGYKTSSKPNASPSSSTSSSENQNNVHLDVGGGNNDTRGIKEQ